MQMMRTSGIAGVKQQLDRSESFREARVAQEKMESELQSYRGSLIWNLKGTVKTHKKADLERAHAEAEARIRHAEELHANKIKNLRTNCTRYMSSWRQLNSYMPR